MDTQNSIPQTHPQRRHNHNRITEYYVSDRHTHDSSTDLCTGVSVIITNVWFYDNNQRFFSWNNRQGKNETWYLVKWCDLPYDQSTWEKENSDLPEISKHISQYEALRYVLSTRGVVLV